MDRGGMWGAEEMGLAEDIGLGRETSPVYGG